MEAHRVRGDATNSAIHHGSKAHVCEVASLFSYIQLSDHPVVLKNPAMLELLHGADNTDHARSIDGLPMPKVQRVFTDLAKVPSHNRGVEQRAMFLKQIQITGARTWQQKQREAMPIGKWTVSDNIKAVTKEIDGAEVSEVPGDRDHNEEDTAPPI